jgi:glutaredoxin 3
MTAAIEIYTRPGCGYCGAAKSLLIRKKAAFVEFDVARDAALRQEMWDRAGVGSTFPQNKYFDDAIAANKAAS